MASPDSKTLLVRQEHIISKLRSLAIASLLLPAFASSLAFGQEMTKALPDTPDPPFTRSATVSGPTYSSSTSSAEDVTAEPQKATDQTSVQAASTPAQPDNQTGQTKRILGILPNFRSVSANQHLPPQSVKDKFVTASQDSFDYSSIVVPALLAGYNQARNQTPEFHQGAAGYGRYLWHSVVDQTTENYLVEFIVPAIAHEDTRYYTLGQGGFKKRAGYALRHVVVTRNDDGKDVFNAGEVVGSAMSAALSNAYYPSPERTFGNSAEQWGTSVGIDAFTFAFREFWPDINHKLFHGEKQ